MASGSGWNLWVWLYSRRWMWVGSMGVVVRRYIDFLSLLFLYPFFFCSSIPTFCSFKKKISVLEKCSNVHVLPSV